MRSLFLKIFFWFWATVIATGVALILTFIVEPRSVPSRWHATLIDTARYSGTIAVETDERDGIGATSAYLERMERETHITACLFDYSGSVIAGTGCQDFLEHGVACDGLEVIRFQHEVWHCAGRADC